MRSRGREEAICLLAWQVRSVLIGGVAAKGPCGSADASALVGTDPQMTSKPFADEWFGRFSAMDGSTLRKGPLRNACQPLR